jgi:hypothetical protein
MLLFTQLAMTSTNYMNAADRRVLVLMRLIFAGARHLYLKLDLPAGARTVTPVTPFLKRPKVYRNSSLRLLYRDQRNRFM